MQTALANGTADVARKTHSGADAIVSSLVLHGAETVFGVPGESYLHVLNSMVDDSRIRYVTCRHESGAAYMAEAYGKLTGRPGICFVTRGPGACNAAIGLHTAYHDSTPMILFIGQVGTGVLEREAFQEIDYRKMFSPVAKWVAQIDRADRVYEFISRAFHTAVNGRPGPVVLVLPEDMQRVEVVVKPVEPYTRIAAHPGVADLNTLRALLADAERPLAIVGGSGWTTASLNNLKSFVEAFDLPVAASFRRQDLFDNDDPHYIGDLSPGMNPALVKRVGESDLILAIGSRLSDLTTGGYSLLDIPRPKQALVHILPGEEELGRIYQPVLGIHSGLPEFAAAASKLARVPVKWEKWLGDARQDYENWQKPLSQAGTLNMSEVMLHLQKRIADDAIVTNGAGNYAIWVHRFHRYKKLRTQLAPTSGAMGYGVPAAVAAKLMYPARTVVCFAGDGCFMMSAQELATAAHYNLKVIFIVVNNGMFGTIRMHQEREFPNRVSGTGLTNPDFVTMAKSYGFYAESVTTNDQFEAALDNALAAQTASLLELRIDPDAITPMTTITKLRANRR